MSNKVLVFVFTAVALAGFLSCIEKPKQVDKRILFEQSITRIPIPQTLDVVRENKGKGCYWSVGISDTIGAADDIDRWLFLLKYRENFALKSSKSRNYEDSLGFGCTLSTIRLRAKLIWCLVIPSVVLVVS